MVGLINRDKMYQLAEIVREHLGERVQSGVGFGDHESIEVG